VITKKIGGLVYEGLEKFSRANSHSCSGFYGFGSIAVDR
jgi:hypothetical protein